MVSIFRGIKTSLLFLMIVVLNDSRAMKKIVRPPIGFRYLKEPEVSASSQHEGERTEHEEGVGKENEEGHHVSEGKKGDKDYVVFYEFDKSEKGHRDDENRKVSYDEKTGDEKMKHEEAGSFEEDLRAEDAEKGGGFDEEGKHQKGYSTKGEHSIFKKDEYEKKHEFYDEYHEDGEHEKQGGYHHQREGKRGGHEKKGHLDTDHLENEHGTEKTYDEGGHRQDKKSRKSAEGRDSNDEHRGKYGKKRGGESGRKWFKSSE